VFHVTVSSGLLHACTRARARSGWWLAAWPGRAGVGSTREHGRNATRLPCAVAGPSPSALQSSTCSVPVLSLEYRTRTQKLLLELIPLLHRQNSCFWIS
jgi:hypothetical protein